MAIDPNETIEKLATEELNALINVARNGLTNPSPEGDRAFAAVVQYASLTPETVRDMLSTDEGVAALSINENLLAATYNSVRF